MPNPKITSVIVIHAPQPWVRANRRWAFRALANTLPPHAGVLIVDRPIDPVGTMVKHPRRTLRRLRRRRSVRESERLAVLHPRLAVHEFLANHIPGAESINTSLLRTQLRAALRRHYPNARKVVQWIHHPHQSWVYRALPGCGTVYHCYDEYNYADSGEFNEGKWDAEKTLLQTVDLVFVTSSVLEERRAPFARRIEILPNGVPAFFLRNTGVSDADIEQIAHPRIGYVGTIFPVIDFEMLHQVFAARPHWQLVMVGPVHPRSPVKALAQLPNVSLVGPRPHEVLPSVLRQFDVGIIPIGINGFTRPLIPLKLFEYMGAGVPIVSTAFPELEQYSSVLELVACEPSAFADAIERTLAQDATVVRDQLQSIARDLTWTEINRHSVVPILQDVFGI